MGDRIAVLNLGVLQQVGTPEELYTRPANVFVARFIGSPAMNVVPSGVIEGVGGTGLLGGLPARARQARRRTRRRRLASRLRSRSSSTSATSSSPTCASATRRSSPRSRSSNDSDRVRSGRSPWLATGSSSSTRRARSRSPARSRRAGRSRRRLRSRPAPRLRNPDSMRLCMFHPLDHPLERGWVGRVDGDRVVQLAAQTLQSFFTGGGSAREHAEYPARTRWCSWRPILHPPSIRLFDEQDGVRLCEPGRDHRSRRDGRAPRERKDTVHMSSCARPRLAAVIGAEGNRRVHGLAEWRAPGSAAAEGPRLRARARARRRHPGRVRRRGHPVPSTAGGGSGPCCGFENGALLAGDDRWPRRPLRPRLGASTGSSAGESRRARDRRRSARSSSGRG